MLLLNKNDILHYSYYATILANKTANRPNIKTFDREHTVSNN